MTIFIIFLSITSFVQAYQFSGCDAPVGHYCPLINNPSHFVKCGKGKYQDLTGQTSCKSCKFGEYNLQTGQSKCKVCPKGYSCLWKNKSPVKCRNGSYQDKRGKIYCRTCPTGKFCSTTGPVIDKRNTRPLPPEKLAAIRNAALYAEEAYQEVNPTETRLKDDERVKGFVKYEGNKIVVSFQGSNDLTDWYRNLKFFKQRYSGCEDCKVHIGFFQSYNALKEQMLEKVSALSDEHSDARVLVTGHSLGGAMATLAAVDLVNAGHRVDLITFGSPRVGNHEFAEHVNGALSGLNLRMTYKDDLVTVVPPLMRFVHVGQEINCVGTDRCHEYPANEDVTHFRGTISDHYMNNYLTI
ncbi:putative lipase LIH1 [Xenia sp. Carnegie-2017]|uniref:putative lipase LIH1 n=1 Tax=Xenia sp. Carnegie-2017 TaxID=2897299 RepID=UPI001F04FB33|nr:putative lipase LIH1 [Xenia sp. Carnegie-2017]